MGSYLNPGTEGFQESRASRIYVDKSGLISRINALIRTNGKYVCVSRPRRFGKSSAMAMLSAYYSYGQDSHCLFDDLSIANDASYAQHMNRYDVIRLNAQEFLSLTHDAGKMLQLIRKYVLHDLLEAYADTRFCDESNLIQVMKDVYCHTGRPFVILIDEWDCLMRELPEDKDALKDYLDFLRLWLKDQDYVALAYMTGILPIRKYGTHSALNMFTEYSMTEPRGSAPYFGFTEAEAEKLCVDWQMGFEECRAWYDGYDLTENKCGQVIHHSLYNPRSVVESMLSHTFGAYWNQTETYEALKQYICLNIDGLKDRIVRMLAGDMIPVDTSGFVNDMTTFSCVDDVLTLLIHLGYLSYHAGSGMVSIPNREVAQVYVTSVIRMPEWHEVSRSLQDSRELLERLWDGDGDAVAAGIDKAHSEIPILKYNDENSLSCTIQLAFWFAREYYTMIRELPAGKGFADICFVPRPLHLNKPAIAIEIKWNRSARGAIAQIRDKEYPEALRNYSGEILLAGIAYDKAGKKHHCVIEQLNK